MDQDKTERVWGTTKAETNPTCLSALKLRYCLDDLRKIKGSVLEVGCGAGMFALAIKKHLPALSVCGCDIDERAINLAKERETRVDFRFGDVYKLPYESASFDAVVSFDVLEHLEEPNKALDEVRRVLKAGGLFHLYVPCEGDVYTIYGIFKRLGIIPKRKYAGHIQQYEQASLRNLLEEKGFRVQRIRFSSHLLLQLIDFSYFLFLSLLRRNVSLTIEGYLDRKDTTPPIFKWFLSQLKAVVAVIGYFESRLLKNFPGHGVHFTCLRV